MRSDIDISFIVLRFFDNHKWLAESRRAEIIVKVGRHPSNAVEWETVGKICEGISESPWSESGVPEMRREAAAVVVR